MAVPPTYIRAATVVSVLAWVLVHLTEPAINSLAPAVGAVIVVVDISCSAAVVLKEVAVVSRNVAGFSPASQYHVALRLSATAPLPPVAQVATNLQSEHVTFEALAKEGRFAAV